MGRLDAMAVAPPCGGLLTPGVTERESQGPRRTIPAEMSLPPLPDLILYGRADCGLCDETRAIVSALLDARRQAGLVTPALVERDIETDPAWERAFFASIPVMELGDRRLELATSAAKVRRLLTDVLDA
jgi:hypothetical protein